MFSLLERIFFSSGFSFIYLLPTILHTVMLCSPGIFNTTSGILYNTNYPDEYINSQKCMTVIEIPSAFYIEITFEKLHTESIGDLNLKGDLCNLDYVEIKVDGEYHRLCGNWDRKEHFLYFKFQTDRVEVAFVSDEVITKSGYVIRWDASLFNISASTNCASTHIDTADSCYDIITEAMKWDDGHLACKSRGAVLARIDTQEIDAAIQNELFAR